MSRLKLTPRSNNLFSVSGFAIMLALSAAAHGSEVLELYWDDLIPELQSFADPFARLKPSQREDLGNVAFLRSRQSERPEEVTETMRAKAEESSIRLQQQGIDVDDLLAQGAQMTATRHAQSQAVVEDLDGRTVRIPGYLLPLEFDGQKVTEFLLVPVLGACIHVPPPPPNQMVYVTYEDGFATQGLYQAVWVNGVIKTEAMNPQLSLVDGSASVATGYTLQAASVESYQN